MTNTEVHVSSPSFECNLISILLDPNSIKKSKLQIIALFADLPATEHDLQNSTFLDVTFEVRNHMSNG